MDSPTLRPSCSGSPNRPCTALHCRRSIQLFRGRRYETRNRLLSEYPVSPPPPGRCTPQTHARIRQTTTAADSQHRSSGIRQGIWACMETEGSVIWTARDTADHGEMSPFIGGDAEPRGDYFREGFHFSNTLHSATDSRNYPADFETARYLGQNTVDAITAAESPLPSRYTGTPHSLQGRVAREDKISASKLTRLGGRRRRVLARWLQAIGAIVVAGGALGALFVRAQLFGYGHFAAPNGSRHS